MTESPSSPERPAGSNGQSGGSNHEDANHRETLEVGAQVLTDLKEIFAASMSECLRAQQAAEAQLRALIDSASGIDRPAVPVDRNSVIAVRALHRCLLDRSKLLLAAIRVAKQIDYKKPQARQVREA